MPATVTLLTAAAATAVIATAWRNYFVSRPGADHAPALNTRSPSRDPAFLAHLFDQVLAERPAGAAAVCDIGGAGQITQASDPRGRIGTVIEVNDPEAVPTAMTEAAFHAMPGRDLDLVTFFGTCMYLDEDHLARYFASVRAKLRPEGWLVIADPEYGSGLERSLRSMAIGWLLATRIDFKPLHTVAAIVRRAGFELVQRESRKGRWYVAYFRPV